MRVPEGAEAHLDVRGGDGGGLGEGEHFCVGGFVCGGDDGREGSASARRSFVRSIDRSIVAFILFLRVWQLRRASARGVRERAGATTATPRDQGESRARTACVPDDG